MSRLATSPWLILGSAVLMALVGCGDKGGGDGGGGTSSTTEGAESPTALVERAKALGDADDFGGIVRLMAPDERPVLSFGMIMFAKMAPAFIGGLGGLAGEEGKAELEAKMAGFEKAMNGILAKHGLSDLEQAEPPVEAQGDPMAAGKWIQKLAPDLDHAAFISEMIGSFSALGDETAGKATNKFKELGNELTDLKLDGDTATGKIGDEQMDFKKVAGRWYFSIASQMGGPR